MGFETGDYYRYWARLGLLFRVGFGICGFDVVSFLDTAFSTTLFATLLPILLLFFI